MQSPSFMEQAFRLAKLSRDASEIPVGAVIVDSVTGNIIASSHNEVELRKDPSAHAELLAIQRACTAKGSKFLETCDLYVTLEPCPMCAAALSLARIRRVYFGAYDPKSGGVEHGPRIYTHPTCHHKPDVYGGIMEAECGTLLKNFFQKRRS